MSHNRFGKSDRFGGTDDKEMEEVERLQEGQNLDRLEREREMVRERLAQREREFDLLMGTNPERVKKIVTEEREKRFHEIERKFEFMRKVTDDRNEERKKKEKFERAAQRFGVVNRYQDIPKRIEETTEDELDKIRKDKLSKTALNLGKSNRFGAGTPNEIISKTGILDIKSGESIRINDQRIKDRDQIELLDELVSDLEVKKKLVRTYGGRVPQIFRANLQKKAKNDLGEFYHPIDSEKNDQLNKDLRVKYQLMKGKVYDYDFNEVNGEYIQRYTKFLREQQNWDGLRKYTIKLKAELQAVKKLLTKIPKLEEPQIFQCEDPKKLKKKGNVSFLISKQSVVMDAQSKMYGTHQRLVEDQQENELVEAAEAYKHKMNSIKNELGKYDIERNENGILEEIGRYLKERILTESEAGIEGLEDDESESEVISEDDQRKLRRLNFNRKKKKEVTFGDDVKNKNDPHIQIKVFDSMRLPLNNY